MHREEMKKFYFSTKIDSTKVKQMKRHKKGCVYYYDKEEFIGIMLEGKFTIEDNTQFGISDLYQLDQIDPYTFCTVVFTVKKAHIYMKYQKVEI